MGFAVKLAKHQTAHIVGHPDILAIFLDKRNELQTTLSPSFLRLSPSGGLIQASNGGGTSAVIAVLDTGVYPKNHRSFTADPSLPPPPSTFSGRCISTPSFNATAYCNNKLVGAKYFYRGYEAALGQPINETQKSKSPRDTERHGTHTASTAAGSMVPGANLFGYANGTAQALPQHGRRQDSSLRVRLPPAQEAAVQQAGGIGAIIPNRSVYGEFSQSSPDLFPAWTVNFANASAIYSYVRSVVNPVARIEFRGAVISQSPSAPRVAAFSSRGPNRFATEILKPDIIAPGVDILAAWTGENSPSSLSVDTRRVEFNIISSTSMACPHVSGIAAMLKVARPNWSPAAIKSALMTTAYNVDNNGNAIMSSVNGQAAGPFELGSGHVDPNRALVPGLVYNATADYYITFLCGLGYTPRQIAIFTNDGTVTDYCSTRPRRSVGDLNYPAFSVVFRRSGGQVTQRRSVTNVGANTNAVYNVAVTAPPGTTLTVTPTRLAFDAQRNTLQYSITLSGGSSNSPYYSWGSIVWSDGQHTVRSPVAATWQ
ncbi:hypothetical protein E2562_002548 [Oryza meyeriana var. granulata]|uniref:Subtilisin-like protease fibronectin type-III domain-containing protein n=1 Tax=Oryza meyeriana var. granulata TaxID=110450 RepID=A0A6G1F2Y3_9ORYZ|nr:hypothetical protein E2562_002548 [Oryza meyeriana var. granulata]